MRGDLYRSRLSFAVGPAMFIAGSDRRGDAVFMVLRVAGLCLILSAATAAGMTAAWATEDGERQCYSRAETRERIHAEKLAEPFAVVKSTAAAMRAEALGARLCRADGAFIYEINLLDRNGRIIHAVVDAVTGRLKNQPR